MYDRVMDHSMHVRNTVACNTNQALFDAVFELQVLLSVEQLQPQP